ncbi:cilia- and flagella-associated protein 44 isoform X1 [Ictalurus punctatus]|uniref:Cilia- and flagella-associated protein 44 n=1 Tax=Ictalurus punctatus TaxID=7998 RepID=A0A9F7R9E7_ICTPU|nr:cilia- and flagella-associated protein 44 isoform X1 [Ictalurus punctatus]XP_053530994.1 cilia- and flagella-associated protein 44 isoform X1 [Ictalurus punctatus]
MAVAFTSPGSNIPENLLQLSHSFGYDCRRRGNLQLLDEDTLAFVAGNVLVLLDMNTKQQRYIPSRSGGGIGAIMPHPSLRYFAMAEKGKQPDIIIYEYPSLQPYRILRGGTGKAYSCVNFNGDGTLLASVGGAPDYMLTVWDWNQEQVVLRCKAFSQDVYRVTFSPDNPGQLTTSGSGHIKFWKMADTVTCLKLQGLLGRFGKTALTDIEGYVELPDGKVVSGSEWGNMLLWDGGLIKVEIGRKDRRTCHAGPIQQFALDEGELITVGADGAVRCWDFETIDTADCVDDSGLFEIEPMNELTIGRNVSLSSMVRSAVPDSTIWFAQDSNGGIWKLDLSFTNITLDPECLFSFHAGAIEGMDVSGFSHLMATTAFDRSLRIFDFLSNKELTVSHYRQGGSALTWAPRTVCGGESLLVVGFEDGVVRLLELYNPQSLHAVAGHKLSELHLKQAFKPHNASVTAISYKHNGQIMATGSVDGTVFFFSVGDSYEPIGFVTVPGPVLGLQWAPQSHERNALLVACQTGHVVEVEAPDTHDRAAGNTYHLHNLPIRHFCFHSIKSRIKRDAEIARRQAMKEERQKEATLQEEKDQEQTPTEEEEEEEELPPIFIPNPPSPLQCAFYSTEPGAFWLSVGGYDSGYLYHCKFAEQQSVDPSERRDEPFAYVPVQDADQNPILTVCFCETRQLLLCGMQDGSIRAYPLESGELHPVHMQAYWALGVHDSQYGSLRQLRVSHDSRFVLSTGADGNIFSFRLLEMEEMENALQRGHAKVPSPRLSLDTEPAPLDIDDPAAYSIETAKQKLELDRLHREAESRKQERRKKLAELRSRFKALLQQNQCLLEHVRLERSELELDSRFREEVERWTAERVTEVRRELAWETERCRIGLQKLQERFLDAVACDAVTVSAIRSDHKVSTYRLVALPNKLHQLKERGRDAQRSDLAAQEQCGPKEQKETHADVITAEEALAATAASQRRGPQGAGGKLAARQAEKLRKAAEKAEKARARIEQRKRDWDELYAAKPSADYEDPEDIRAIRSAAENMGDFKLKTAKDFTVPEHLRMNVEKKTAQVIELEEQIYQRKIQMNERVLALRDSKVALVSQFHSQMRQLQAVQKLLPPDKHRPPPATPTLTPEETPEREMQYSRTTLKHYAAARAKMSHTSWDEKHEEPQDVLEMMQQEGDEDTHAEEEHTHAEEEHTHAEEEHTHAEEVHTHAEQVHTHAEEEHTHAEEEHTHAEEVHAHSRKNLSELEQEMMEVEEIRNLYLQDKLMQQLEEAVCVFDARLRLLRHEKSTLDVQMKLADLRHVTLSQELLMLKEFEKREITLQERLNACVQEERELRLKLEECKYQLEVKKRDIAKLHEREKVLASTFQASLGDNNKFADFLTRVFKKKIKRVKKKEKPGTDEEEEESEEDSDEESDWDSDEDDESLDGAGGFDDSVCPQNCDPELFESTLSLREHRLDLEELLHEEKMIADSLRKECDSLTKKEKIVQSNLKAAEGDLELLNREKQQKVNELDVVVPLRLHQIEYMNNGAMPSDLSGALLMNAASVSRLHERIKELQQEKSAQRQLYRQASQQHVQLRNDLRDMEAECQELKAHCEQVMFKKFGKLVDLEALQTLSGSRKLEEMKYERQVREAQNRQELRMWQMKVAAAKQELTDVTREHTARLRSLNSLLTEKKLLDDKLNARQRKMSHQFQGSRQADQEDIQRLQLHVQNQAEKIKWLKQEISNLSRKGGHVLPPSEPSLPSLPSIHRNTPLQRRRALP